MDFTLTEEQQMITDSLGKYLQNELKPVVREYRDYQYHIRLTNHVTQWQIRQLGSLWCAVRTLP